MKSAMRKRRQGIRMSGYERVGCSNARREAAGGKCSVHDAGALPDLHVLAAGLFLTKLPS